jgi:hypothetical protein
MKKNTIVKIVVVTTVIVGLAITQTQTVNAASWSPGIEHWLNKDAAHWAMACNLNLKKVLHLLNFLTTNKLGKVTVIN